MINARRRRLFTASMATVAAAALPVPAVAAVQKKTAASRTALAPTPPMGWNSWNSFATTINEWYEPNANGYDYRKDAELTMDEYGRLLPAPNRFPSAAQGKGFKSLADQIRARASGARARTAQTVALRDLWTRRDLPAARGVIRQTIKPHGSVLLRLSA